MGARVTLEENLKSKFIEEEVRQRFQRGGSIGRITSLITPRTALRTIEERRAPSSTRGIRGEYGRKASISAGEKSRGCYPS